LHNESPGQKGGADNFGFCTGRLVFIIRQCKDERGTNVTNKTAKKDESTVDRDKGFDRRISYLEYSKHAKCRMECRRISQAEVEEIMQDGKINYNKSDLQNARCPRYALEGITGDNQKTRIVFAQCNDKTNRCYCDRPGYGMEL
jgi:hypothetical protein